MNNEFFKISLSPTWQSVTRLKCFRFSQPLSWRRSGRSADRSSKRNGWSRAYSPSSFCYMYLRNAPSYRKRSSQMGRFRVVLIKPRSDNNSVITWHKVIVTVVGSTGKFDLNSARPPTCFTTLPSSSMRIKSWTRTPSLTFTCDTGKRIYRVNDESYFSQDRQDQPDQPCNSYKPWRFVFPIDLGSI